MRTRTRVCAREMAMAQRTANFAGRCETTSVPRCLRGKLASHAMRWDATVQVVAASGCGEFVIRCGAAIKDSQAWLDNALVSLTHESWHDPDTSMESSVVTLA